MSDAQSIIVIRTARLTDQAALVNICHQTGDIRVDPYLFGLRWCLDYLWHDTENCFVAEDTHTGQVVGYILCALDSAVQAERVRRKILPEAKRYYRQLPTKTFHDWRFLFFLRWFDWEVFNHLYTDFPAHLHINLDSNYRRMGIGARLLAAYEDNLRQKGIPGYHLGVGGSNQVGIGFYRKMGLNRLSAFPPVAKPLVIAFGRRLDRPEI